MASKHLWLTKLSYNGSAAIERLGIIRTEYDTTDKCFKTYRFVKTDTDTLVYNGVCLANLAAGTYVTGDVSDANVGAAAGVGIGHIHPKSYGWIQIGGFHGSVLLNNTTAAEGQAVTLSSTDYTGTTYAVGQAAAYKTLGYIAYGCGSKAVMLNCIDVQLP